MKSTKKIFVGIGLLLATVSLVISACKKEESYENIPAAPSRLSVYLTDDPCQFDSAYIDIRYVEVKLDTTEHQDDDDYVENDDDSDDNNQNSDQYGKWDTLEIREGVYNILRLRNGIDTLLGTVELAAGKVRKIRLTLGTENSVIKSGISHPLILSPNNNYAYVRIKKEAREQINSGEIAIWLDFDVCGSIQEVNGQYHLRPAIRPFSISHFGKVDGKIFPNAATPFVTVFNATDSANAMPFEDGKYVIRGLKQGTYSITYKAYNGYKDTTITGIEVKNGMETTIPDITLHQ